MGVVVGAWYFGRNADTDLLSATLRDSAWIIKAMVVGDKSVGLPAGDISAAIATAMSEIAPRGESMILGMF